MVQCVATLSAGRRGKSDSWIRRRGSEDIQLPPAGYSHEVRGVGGPVGSIFTPHFQSLFPQLPPERVLEAAEDKHHPLHYPLERDLRPAGFLGFGFGSALPLLVGRLRRRRSCGEDAQKFLKKEVEERSA